MNTSTIYRPATARSPRRLPRPGVKSLVAAALIVSAGSVTLDAMTPAAARPAVHQVVAAPVRGVEARVHSGPAGQVHPHPAASSAAKKKHHILRKLLLPLRMIRHVHRFLRIARNPFSLRRWFW